MVDIIFYFIIGLLVVPVIMLFAFIGQVIGMLSLMLFDIVSDYIRNLRWI